MFSFEIIFFNDFFLCWLGARFCGLSKKNSSCIAKEKEIGFELVFGGLFESSNSEKMKEKSEEMLRLYQTWGPFFFKKKRVQTQESL